MGSSSYELQVFVCLRLLIIISYMLSSVNSILLLFGATANESFTRRARGSVQRDARRAPVPRSAEEGLARHFHISAVRLGR